MGGRDTRETWDHTLVLVYYIVYHLRALTVSKVCLAPWVFPLSYRYSEI